MGNLLSKLFKAAFPPLHDQSHGSSGTPDVILRRTTELLKPVSMAYQRRYQEYGSQPKGVFWADTENVEKRFETLARAFSPQDILAGGASINDLGCGYGALFDYLAKNPVLTDGSYNGYDICQPLLDSCANRIQDKRAHFHHSSSALQQADYSLVSGTYNLKMAANDDQWLTYVFASIQDLWAKTDKALAFNMLDSRLMSEPQGLYFAQVHQFEDFCCTHLSDNVEIMIDYGLPDFTVFVRR